MLGQAAGSGLPEERTALTQRGFSVEAKGADKVCGNLEITKTCMSAYSALHSSSTTSHTHARTHKTHFFQTKYQDYLLALFQIISYTTAASAVTVIFTQIILISSSPLDTNIPGTVRSFFFSC